MWPLSQTRARFFSLCCTYNNFLSSSLRPPKSCALPSPPPRSPLILVIAPSILQNPFIARSGLSRPVKKCLLFDLLHILPVLTLNVISRGQVCSHFIYQVRALALLPLLCRPVSSRHCFHLVMTSVPALTSRGLHSDLHLKPLINHHCPYDTAESE